VKNLDLKQMADTDNVVAKMIKRESLISVETGPFVDKKECT
jgi:hypothetical protein